jgi:tetratricopeptide (TPR) repeat protein
MKLCYHLRGVAWLAVGRYNEAISDLSESLRLPPVPLPGPTGDALTYSLRAAAYLSIGNREKVLADRSECIRLDPSAVNYSNRGFDYNFFGMFDEAVQDLTTAILLEPKNTVYRGYRAAAFEGWGKFDRALADVDAALAGDKGSSSASLNSMKKQICGDARRAGQTFDTCLGF